MGVELALGAALFGAQMYQQRREERKAKQEMRRASREQMSIEQSYRDRLAKRDEDQSAAANAARDRQRMATAGNVGRRSTILTSPLGLQGEPETARPTLLGA